MSTTVFGLAREMDAIRARTRRSQILSGLMHAAVILWLILHRQLAPAPEQLVEVTWLDPVPALRPELVAVELAPAMLREMVAPEPADTPDPKEVRFERTTETAEQAPRPQDTRASRDAVQARLENLRTTRESSAALAAAANPRSRLVAAVTTSLSDAAAPSELQRAAAPAAAAPLARSTTPTRRPALAAAAPTSSALSRALPEKPAAATAERVLGSARLSGEVADRQVTHHEMPLYPDWATRDAVEADVTLRFVVRPDGQVTDGVQVTRTAGFLDFDDAAVAALRRWRFAPVPKGQSADQWGSITFHFRLRDRR